MEDTIKRYFVLSNNLGNLMNNYQHFFSESIALTI